MSDETIQMMLKDEVLIPSLIFGGVIIVVAMNVVGGCIKSVARERTRREIAAFIAEGSMTPEQGERLMKSGGSKCG
jgi:hypothetical protein